MTSTVDRDYQPAFPRKEGVVAKADPKPCALCALPTRAHCPVCGSRVCAICTLADARQRCRGCAV